MFRKNERSEDLIIDLLASQQHIQQVGQIWQFVNINVEMPAKTSTLESVVRKVILRHSY
jgi:hypothetical protein